MEKMSTFNLFKESLVTGFQKACDSFGKIVAAICIAVLASLALVGLAVLSTFLIIHWIKSGLFFTPTKLLASLGLAVISVYALRWLCILMAGYVKFYLNLYSNKTTPLSTIFSGSVKNGLRLFALVGLFFLISLLFGLLAALSGMVFVSMGLTSFFVAYTPYFAYFAGLLLIVALAAFVMAPFLIVDRNMEVFKALKSSSHMTKGYVIAIAGIIAFGVMPQLLSQTITALLLPLFPDSAVVVASIIGIIGFIVGLLIAGISMFAYVHIYKRLSAQNNNLQ